jgi:DNA polymerase/3'-5' exonuclease PolX
VQHLENKAIAERLDSFATLLELAGANPYSARAYRRAADLIRATQAPVADLIRAGRVRELRGIGPGWPRRGARRRSRSDRTQEVAGSSPASSMA